MKTLLVAVFAYSFLTLDVKAQDPTLSQNFLFDDSDIIVKANIPSEEKTTNTNSKEIAKDAVNAAKNLLNQKPLKLQSKNFPKIKKSIPTQYPSPSSTSKLTEAPFGLLWNSSIIDTRNQGIKLTVAEMKDYTNSFLATNLPKPLDFFDRVYVVFGQENELYRILAYSNTIEDDSNASKVLQQYQKFSQLLEKKYGNKEEDFTPAIITKTSTDAQGKEITITEEAPIGNPEFLSQLETGTAVLFSTYHNDNVAAALSIGVDGNKKSYIVIDYKNLKILKEQEAQTLEAL